MFEYKRTPNSREIVVFRFKEVFGYLDIYTEGFQFSLHTGDLKRIKANAFFTKSLQDAKARIEYRFAV